MSTTESVESFSHAVFVAVPLDDSIETIETAAAESSDAECNRPRRKHARKTKLLEDSVLFWMLVAATTMVACLPFLGVSLLFIRLEKENSYHEPYDMRSNHRHDDEASSTDAAWDKIIVSAGSVNAIHHPNTKESRRWDYARPQQVTDLTQDNFTQFLKDHDMAFVSFYDPDSEWQRWAPIWEEFAQVVGDRHMPIRVGRVNCATEEFCRDQRLDLSPTLLWFQGGVRQHPDYVGVRSLQHAIDLAELNVKYKERVIDKTLQKEYLQMLNMVESRHRSEFFNRRLQQ